MSSERLRTERSGTLIAAFGQVLEEQASRWREVIVETGDERVEALAQDALREVEALQDALLIGHFQDALNV